MVGRGDAPAAPGGARAGPEKVVPPFLIVGAEKQRWFFTQVAGVRDKIHESIPPWDELLASKRFAEFCSALTALELDRLPLTSVHDVLVLLITAFQSLEIEQIRTHFWPLCQKGLFSMLSRRRLELEIAVCPELKGPIAKIKRRVERDPSHLELQRMYLPSLFGGFFFGHLAKTDALLLTPGAEPAAIQQHALLCCRFVEFATDLLCQMPTRRWFRAYIEDIHFYIHCTRSHLASPEVAAGHLFRDMLDIFKFYIGFEVNDHNSEPMTANDCETHYAAKVTALQRSAWKYFKPKLIELAMCSAASVEERTQLSQYLQPLSVKELMSLCVRLCVLDDEMFQNVKMERGFLIDVLLHRHERRTSEVERLNTMPLYPDEKLLWNYNLVPGELYTGEAPYALPKLNVQFLTIQDYLLRNFNLMRLESTHEIRDDVEDALLRVQPRPDADGPGVIFTGKSRMVLPIRGFQITKVAAPLIGFTRPAEVRAEMQLSLAQAWPVNVREEWEQLRQHDVLILIGFRPVPFNPEEPDMLKRYGITYIRGCELLDTRDENDNVFTGLGDSGVRLSGDKRTYRLQLDPSQYQRDVNAGLNVYDSFTVVMRRKPKENNFKAVLETIRDLMTFPTVVPQWLHNLFLGYGDPDSAHYSRMSGQIRTVDFKDTLIDPAHIEAAFPGKSILWKGDGAVDGKPTASMKRPFKVTFPVEQDSSDEEDPKEGDANLAENEVAVERYERERGGPYPEDIPKQNSVRFTDVQIEAIRAASNPGLTMVVGPPGTGKTDVAVQIISNIYNNFPNQVTLVVTHSNAALNDIFEKTAEKDIDERYLLRLGMGEKELQTERDYSKWGRVNYMLGRRLTLLERVAKLAKVIGVDTQFAYTCETSEHFYLHHVLSRWEKFQKDSGNEENHTEEWVKDTFPFTDFFDDTPSPFWEATDDYASALSVAKSGWVHLQRIFDELADCKAFELLRSSYDRGNYLVTKQAKIIAMTCTHAALKRRDFIRLGFKYDNLVMEESAQILEVETFIPMLLQQPGDTGESRLKRVVLIGDHNQLPPVVKNLCFQKYSHMDQSLFARFVRLGVPTVQLHAQGRMRAQLADLFRWRYSGLRDLPHVLAQERFRTANTGFAHVYQCVDVPDWRGRGETEPQPHFFQNVAEAEYIVHTYMYMRLLGYPASRISILTTYNGQKHLIRDVINHRCGAATVFGEPPAVMTVDKFQGRQNDYVLLSLVRTARVGHLRDPRRLVVALSRARLGLYVFCRCSLFQSVWELRPAFELLLRRPAALALNDETPDKYPTFRAENNPGNNVRYVSDMEEMGLLVRQMTDVAVAIEGQNYLRQQREIQAQRAKVREEQMRGSFDYSAAWAGPRHGWYFGDGDWGVGYYRDPRHDPDAPAPPRLTPRAPPPAVAVPKRRRIDVEEEDTESGDQDPERAPPSAPVRRVEIGAALERWKAAVAGATAAGDTE